MYVRESQVKQKSGIVSYLQLVRKVRDQEAGRQKLEVLYHFGRTDQLDKDALKRLINGFSRYLDPDDAAAARANAGITPGIESLSARPIGATWLLDGLWKRLQIDRAIGGLLTKRNFKTPIERLIFAMVADRALAPISKLAMEEWVEKDVVIPDLEAVKSDQLYRAMDFLLAAQDQLQERVFFSVAHLLNLEVDIIFLDTTSTYFEIEGQDEPDDARMHLRRWGKSKDRRGDLAQVSIGFAMTREGIPVRCWVWPGNTNDLSVLEEVKRDLNGWKLGRVITVADTGFNSEMNRRTLQTAGGHYILGEKLRGIKDNELILSHPGRFKRLDDGLEIKEVKLKPDGTRGRKFVVVKNPDQAKREKAKRDDIVAEVERRLAELKQLDGEPHTKKACELRSHDTFGCYVTQTPKTHKLTLDRKKIAAEELLDGKYLVSTSDDSLTAEDIVCGYKALWRIERAFRDLKHVLDVRPVYHRLSDRIRAHVLLCWLALVLVRVAENETGKTWSNLRAELGRQMLCGYKLADGEVWQTTRPTPEQTAAYQAVKVAPPPRHVSITAQSQG